TLMKSIPGTSNSKENFDATWETVVKEMVTVSAAPEMQPPSKDEEWEAQSGYATFESDGNKGIALLVTLSGLQKMVNIIVLTNTDVYEKDVTAFLESINFAKQTENTNTRITPAKQPEAKTTAKGAFTFTTTNFDDGWVAAEQADWVQVSKGTTRVLIHYPNKTADAYNSVVMDGLKKAWNILVAPRYSTASNFEFKPISGWQTIEFAEADAVEKITGKTVHVVLFKMNYSNGSGKYLEFITPDKQAFEQEFGAYHETSYGWEKMENMIKRNKFAIVANDLLGKWSTSDYASLTYYYVNTGSIAGTTSTSTADEFTFLQGNNYRSNHSGASGMAGNMKFSSQNYKGKYSVTNWSVTLTNRFQGATEKYDCYFEAIKGGRILLMTDRLGTTHSLVRQ
ncbi:MAG TPA: hypothetical protein PKA77_18405, partial [Chitinophagaceae bacterium]|nr:hypothetical protein [Chitinophagaceae bacterium]